MDSVWTPAERRAWAWPQRLNPSQWAEANRILSADVTAEPGPWRNERTPYLACIMDAIHEPGAEMIVVLKAAQVGFSEAIRNLLGFWIDHEPGPCLMVMPDQKSAEELMVERIKPLLDHTPAVARHVSLRAWDTKKTAIRLDTMSVYFGWAGSSQSLKSRPIRYILFDEPDEYPAYSGATGDPISKGLKRLTTYMAKGRARAVLGGTPTVRMGNVWRWFESCGDRRHYWVPCPHCGKYQTLKWGGKGDGGGVKWLTPDEPDRMKRAAMIEERNLAYYQCEHCAGKIKDSHKLTMLNRGVWAGEDQIVAADGRVTGPTRHAKRIGFQISAIYSPWVSFSKLAGEFVAAKDDPMSLADFMNQRLAEVFEEQRAKTQPGIIMEKANGAPEPMMVPSWAKWLFATADTQGNSEADGYFYYVIRAWGFGYRSQLVDYGICSTPNELKSLVLDRPIPSQDGAVVTPQMLLVDSGGPRWSEIYEFSLSDPRIHPTKGMNVRRTWMVEERPQKKHGVVLWEIDTDQAKDMLHRLIHDPDASKWLPHCKVDDRYASQLCAESKIFDPKLRREVWTEIVKKNNHLWDCETLQCAAAWRAGAGLPEQQPQAAQPAPPMTTADAYSPVVRPSRW